MTERLGRLCAAVVSVVLLTACSSHHIAIPPSLTSVALPAAVDQMHSPASSAPATTEGLQISIIGDSFTSGTHYGGWGSKNWTNLLQHSLAKAGYDVYMQRSARGGAGYRHIGPSGTTYGSEAERDINPDTKMIVFFGSDSDADSVDGLYGAVVTAINTARQKAPGAPILVIGPGWCRASAPSQDILATRDAVRDASQTTGVTFIDPIDADWFEQNPNNIAPDGVHPTDAGHAIIAERLLGPFLDALRTVAPPPAP